MANLSEDIQCAGSDTRPPMLDKTDFASWQQRIRLYSLYYRVKEIGSLNLGPERPRVYSDLSQDEKDRCRLVGSVMLQLQQGRPQSKEQHSTPKRSTELRITQRQDVLMQAQEKGVVLDESSHVDNVFQPMIVKLTFSDCLSDATHTHNYVMENLSSADPVCDEAEHGMQDDVQPSYVVDSHVDHTSDSNMTPYDQYVKDNAMLVVQNNASTVPNDMYMMIDNDLHEPKAQSVFKAPTYTVADNSLNAELAIYKE
ncbi:hypothetical protein Tco_0971696 [Tanacetum coccineum]